MADLTQQIQKLDNEVTKQEFQVKKVQNSLKQLTDWPAIILVSVLQYISFLVANPNFMRDSTAPVTALFPAAVWLVGLSIVKLITMFRK